MENAILVKDLKRDFIIEKGWLKRKRSIIHALNGVSFSVKQGEIFGLLGQNGAGKTTIIKILISLLAPTSGTAKVLGYDTFGEEKNFKHRINFIFGGEQGFYRRLTAKENLEYFSNLYYISDIEAKKNIQYLLELVDLTKYSDQKVETFSKGMLQRLQIAKGLVNNPEIIFMDEPTIGLDPIGARLLREIIKKLKVQGKTILLTTHYLHEAEELCDNIAIINKGRIIRNGTVQDIKQQSSNIRTTEVIVSRIQLDAIEQIKNNEMITEMEQENLGNNTKLTIKHKDYLEFTSFIVNNLKDMNIISLQKKEISLEDSYIDLIGGE